MNTVLPDVTELFTQLTTLYDTTTDDDQKATIAHQLEMLHSQFPLFTLNPDQAAAFTNAVAAVATATQQVKAAQQKQANVAKAIGAVATAIALLAQAAKAVAVA